MSNSTYNILKHVAATGLPALITLYFAIASIWHIGHTDQVMGTMAAFNAFLGALMGYSTFTYNTSGAKYDGEIQVDNSGPKTIAQMVLNDSAGSILDKPTATFKVTSSPGLAVSSPPQS